MYKKGDVIILKTIYEMPMDKILNRGLPKNRIVIIDEMYEEGCFVSFNGGSVWILNKRIKGYANEYYLQEIKDEL